MTPIIPTRAPTKFFVAGGTMRVTAPSYVSRPADEELPAQIQAGEYCYILTPRQMGKSSLMKRTAQRLKRSGMQVAQIDLTQIGTQITAETSWYLSFLVELARPKHLNLKLDVPAWWAQRSQLAEVQRFIHFMQEVVLTDLSGPVVIFIDEIDTTLKFDFRDDFFAAVRYLHNARADEAVFDRLVFVMLGVASPADLIADPSRTPFNVGKGILLEEFSRADAAILQPGLEQVCGPSAAAAFERIYHWTSGHPYLTQKLCLELTEQLAQSDNRAATDITEQVDVRRQVVKISITTMIKGIIRWFVSLGRWRGIIVLGPTNGYPQRPNGRKRPGGRMAGFIRGAMKPQRVIV